MRLPAIILPVIFLCHTAMAEDAAVIELRETISKIVDTQTLESKERADWKARKAEMQNLLELHQKELTLLDEELGKAGTSAPGHANSSDSIKSQIEALKVSRRATVEAVARNVPRTIALAKLFPTPLKKEAEPELAALNSWKPSDEPREALQSIIALLTKANQFNRRFTRTTEVRDNREVQVLYLGLARAFYTDTQGNAGIGQPGTDGWTWKSRPEIHSQLTAALDTLEKKQAPAMVELPLQIIER